MTTVQTAEALLSALVVMPSGPSGELDSLVDLLLENGVDSQTVATMQQHFAGGEHGAADGYCIYKQIAGNEPGIIGRLVLSMKGRR